MKSEKLIWRGKSSQLVNTGTYFLGTLIILLFLDLTQWDNYSNLVAAAAAGWMLWKYLEVQCDEYIITSQRIQRRTGIINRRTFDIEMYRVHDIELREPLFYRIFGLGNIRVMNFQYDKNTFYLRAIPFPQKLREDIRTQSETSSTLYLPSHSSLLELPN